jgi:hypothetical protein
MGVVIDGATARPAVPNLDALPARFAIDGVSLGS